MPRTYPEKTITQRFLLPLSAEDRLLLSALATAYTEAQARHVSKSDVLRQLLRAEAERLGVSP